MERVFFERKGMSVLKLLILFLVIENGGTEILTLVDYHTLLLNILGLKKLKLRVRIILTRNGLSIFA